MAKKDMFVKELQNPTAVGKVYSGFKFNPIDNMENKPDTKMPKIITIKTLTVRP